MRVAKCSGDSKEQYEQCSSEGLKQYKEPLCECIQELFEQQDLPGKDIIAHHVSQAQKSEKIITDLLCSPEERDVQQLGAGSPVYGSSHSLTTQTPIWVLRNSSYQTIQSTAQPYFYMAPSQGMQPTSQYGSPSSEITQSVATFAGATQSRV